MPDVWPWEFILGLGCARTGAVREDAGVAGRLKYRYCGPGEREA